MATVKELINDIDNMVPGKTNTKIEQSGDGWLITVTSPEVSNEPVLEPLQCDSIENGLELLANRIRAELNRKARLFAEENERKTAIQLQAKMGKAPPDPAVPVPQLGVTYESERTAPIVDAEAVREIESKPAGERLQDGDVIDNNGDVTLVDGSVITREPPQPDPDHRV